MTARFDFAHTPQQRRRRAETGLYRALTCAALLGALPVLAWAWHLEGQTHSLDAALALVAGHQQNHAPAVEQAHLLETRIADLHAQLALHDAAAQAREQPARLMLALAADIPGLHMRQLSWRQDAAQLHGWARTPEQVQTFITHLRDAGLPGVTLQALQLRAQPPADGRLDFALLLPTVSPP